MELPILSKENIEKSIFSGSLLPEEEILSDANMSTDIGALIRLVKNEFKQYVKLNPKISADYVNSVQQIEQAGKLCDIVSSHLPVKTEIKQELLEIFSSSLRLDKILELSENRD